MTLCTFTILVVFLTYISFGIFTYYLEWGRTPYRLFLSMRQRAGTSYIYHWYMLGAFVKTIIWWPTFLSTTWKIRLEHLLWRVKIILFLWVNLFCVLSMINFYVCFSYQTFIESIMIEYILWISSGAWMYILSSIYTGNKDEALSFFGIGWYLFILLLPGPFAVSKIYERLKENIDHHRVIL